MGGLTWLHVSDWHQQGKDFDRRVVRDALFRDIGKRASISPALAKLDFVIFSGDLAYSGRVEEYEMAMIQFLNPLLEACGLKHEQLFIVPGNHDLDREEFYRLPDELKTPLKSNKRLEFWLDSDENRSSLLKPFQTFVEFVKRYTGQENPDYANTRQWEIEGKKIAILGLNSAWICGGMGNLGERGHVLIGEPQIHESLKELSEADIKIAVFHHPFYWLEEFDGNRVEERLMKECNFILFGHQHMPKANVIVGTSGQCVIIPAGSCYDRRIPDNPIYASSYNFVHLDLESERGIVFLRRWSERGTKWIEDVDTHPNGKLEFIVPKLHSSQDTSEKGSPAPNEPFQVPSLPEHFIQRPELSERIKARLLTDSAAHEILLINAIHGLGGAGKTILAIAIAHDNDVQKRFFGGILWANLGQDPDLLSILSGWIQELGDYEYHPTTIKAASDHLRTLLRHKSVLLVIDDAWCLDHVCHLLVGGSHCQALITTREYSIIRALGAANFEMDVMTQDQSLNLLSKCLRRALNCDEMQKALDLVKKVGCLPLAVELAAAQINDGVSWTELLEELGSEVAKLESLDYQSTNEVDETTRRRLSLITSFKLSYQRLSEKDQAAFAWLGILPEDAILTSTLMATVWDIDEKEARDLLRRLRNKALLLPSSSQKNGGQGYRIHDLIHDLARSLIVAPLAPIREGNLPGLGLSLNEAHTNLLEHYKNKTQDSKWCTLPKDGYIHNRLTWHMQMAGQLEKIHDLLAEETPNNKDRNGWYDAQESLGQISAFIYDVTRIKQATEEKSNSAIRKGEPATSIGQEIRYALILASINSLAERIPPVLYAGLVESGIWGINHALTFAHQISDEKKRSRALFSLAPIAQSKRDEILRGVSNLVAFQQTMNYFIPSRAASSVIECNRTQEDLRIMLNDARRIEDPYYGAETMAELALQLSGCERKSALLEALSRSQLIRDQLDLEMALNSIRIQVPFDKNLSDKYMLANYDLLRKSLHDLAGLNRNECLKKLIFLAPNIRRFGTENAIEETLRAIRDVGRWWP